MSRPAMMDSQADRSTKAVCLDAPVDAPKARQLAAAVRSACHRMGAGLAVVAPLIALSGMPDVAQADAVIQVTPGAAGINTGDGCSLVEAIINANANGLVHSECTAGSGADTIVLAGNTYSYDTAFGADEAALPLITSPMTIEGNGAIIRRNSGTMRVLRIEGSGDLTLNSSTISGGNSDNRGGGILNLGSLTLNESTVEANQTTSFGGGIYNLGGTLTANNSTISGNAGATGGMDVSGGTVTLNNSTITGNTASSGTGGGVYLLGGTLNVSRSIISGNNGQEVSRAGGSINANNRNLFGHSGLTNAQAFTGFTPGASDRTATSDGTNPTPLGNILNTTLANNGGPTRTHALVSGSPAIDYIPTTDANCNPGVTRDQRGALRASGSGFGGSTCDVGAFEFASTISFPVTASTSSGNGEISPAAQEVPAGSNAVFSVTPDPGWSVLSVTGDTCTPAPGVGNEWVAENITQACAVEASFVINTYVVMANTGAGQGSITPVVQVTDHGADATFTVTPQTGWSVTTVVGYTCTPVQGVGNQWVASNITEACSVTANFAQDSFEVSAAVVQGEGSISPATQNVIFDGTATFTVEPDTGWFIGSVTGDTCDPAPTSGDEWQATNIQVNCSVDASFVINTYTVTAAVGVGEGSIDPGSQNVEHGSDATFTVTPDTGWSVTTVTGDTCNPVFDSGDQWVAAGITEACAVTANFAQDTFTVEASVLSGQGSINPDSQNVVFDGTATFTVEPDTGWSVDDVTGDSCSPTSVGGTAWEATNIQANCSVEASFVINTYTVTAAVGVGEGSINPGSQDVDHGSDATFTLIPDTGWSVTSVTGDTCDPLLDSGDQWVAADITQACAVTANFAQDSFTIGGTVSGLAGAGLVLQNNDGDDLAIDEDGDFTFASELVDGSDYSVTVLSQPTGPSQACIVTHGEGTLAGSNVSDIVVNCTTDTFTIGGNLTGLASGNSLTLQNNGEDDLILSTNGDFTFTTALDDLNDYAVSISAQPTGQFCSVENGTGTLAGANVEDVAVTCVALELGLSLNDVQFPDLEPGETNEQTLMLTNTGLADLVIEAFGAPDAPFSFSAGDCTPLPLTLEPDESCTVMLSFTPTSGGTFDDQLAIFSNTPSSPNQIGLSGSSARPPIPVPTLGPLALLLLTLSMLVLGIRLTRA